MDIAIVGMAAHLPGAQNIAEYWANLRGGISSIVRLDDAALLAAGERPDRLRQPNYVKAAARLDGFADFDPAFFGFSPKDAAILDPQHRQFLEVSWEAFENAGHVPAKFPGNIGVYAGCGMGSYFYFNLCSHRDLVDDVGMFLLRHTGNDKDFLATRVSHVFDLQGPSIGVQTACSTSLVAIHHAAQALRSGDCDMALAGGVTVELPQGRGYLYRENEVLSPDGECHAFDSRAQGTVFGSGAGVVLLRRLEDAVADGDHIWAVLKGSAVNNDGAQKAGYLAPSVGRQADAAAAAIAAAGVEASSLGYVECHGTGTYLGDPIEISALTDAYRRTTDKTGFCRVGSVKTNIGHLDTAAGVASLIKASLALHHKEIPASLGYERPNPAIDFEHSPFRVNDSLTPWDADGPRRAGVNSLGVGGTNAHAVLEEAPVRASSEQSDWPFQPILLSAKSKGALDGNTAALAEYLRRDQSADLADIAFTLKEGRHGFDKRRVTVAETHTEAAALLEENDPRRVFTHEVVGDNPDVVFLFPGGGAQYPNMAQDLYETEPVFREWMDKGLEVLQADAAYDARAIWLPEPEDRDAAAETLKKPSVQLPLIMMVEYALAKLWMSWGVEPKALVGHSMGENTAACLAGVMTFEDCIRLMHLRGRLFDTVPAGGMLSVGLSADAVAPYLADDLDIASINAPELVVISGPDAALDALAERLKADDIDSRRIRIDIAAHSKMLDPILAEFGAFLRGLDLKAPQIPIVSNRTGDWLTDAQATDPDYWVGHLRNTVRYAECMATLAADGPAKVYLEVGPGQALTALTGQAPGVTANQVIPSLRPHDLSVPDDAWFLGVIGRLWAVGVDADWAEIWTDRRRVRVPLPTYQFQRARYYIEPAEAAEPEAALPERLPLDDWAYRPQWRPRYADCDLETALARRETWLLFTDEEGYATALAERLRGAGHEVVEVASGDTFARVGQDRYVLAPEMGPEGYEALLHDLTQRGAVPTRIGHFWLVTADERCRPGSSFFDRNMEHGHLSLLNLAQAMEAEGIPRPLHLTLVTSDATGEGLRYPEKAMAITAAGVIPRELPGVTCSTLDIGLVAPLKGGKAQSRRVSRRVDAGLNGTLLEELLATPANYTARLRDGRRAELHYAREALPAPAKTDRAGKTYLITGGLGGIGLTMAEHLLTEGAKVALVTRSDLPPRPEWAERAKGIGANARRIEAALRLSALGELELVTADVCNPDDMQRAVDQVTQALGPITGVIHAAGVIDDGPLLQKSAETVARVLAPKVQGTRVLDQIFPDGSLEEMVLFASSSTVTRPAGQIDYAPANDFLNAFAQSRRGGKTRVTAVNWGIWAEVGMAQAALGGQEARPLDLPLLDQVQETGQGRLRFSASYGTDRWVMDEHRTATGAAVMPGTGYVELVAEAWDALGESKRFVIEDLSFLRPMQLAEEATSDLRVTLDQDGPGARLRVQSGVKVEGRTGYQTHAQARVLPLLMPVEVLKLSDIRARMGTPEAGDLYSPQERHLKFGPRWRALRERAFGEGQALARLELPQAAAGDGCLLPPGLMDLATGWAVELAPGYDATDLWVPIHYRRMAAHAPLPQEVVSWVRLAESGNDYATFDITLAAPDGSVCVDIDGFSMQRIGPASALSAMPAAPADLQFDEAQALSPAEARLRHALSQGIRPAEGAAAMMRALTMGKPQIVLSSLDLDALIAQADSPPETKSAMAFARADADADHVAPETPVEMALAKQWEELLGVANVGTTDSFFDLGGHSLIAVRFFSGVKRQFGVDFPISVLFEAPTIAKLAERIEAQGGGAAVDREADAPGGASEEPDFTHLVRLNETDSGTPFFLVAGMFGNVMNLRSLAHALGRDRPVWGLQARGLLGGMEPHDTLVDAARDYLAEIKRVQPEGPYMLGGFSGGGITAYEMAQQLRAEGEDVSALVLLDTPLPMRPLLSRRDKLMIRFHEIRERGPRFIGEWLEWKLRYAREQRAAREAAEVEAAESTGFQNAAIEAAFRRGIECYDLKAWDGPVALFRPPLDRQWRVSGGQWVSTAREYVFEDNDWARWAEQIKVIEVPGDHDSMVLDPNVRVLSARLGALLTEQEKAAKRTASGPAGGVPLPFLPGTEAAE